MAEAEAGDQAGDGDVAEEAGDDGNDGDGGEGTADVAIAEEGA